MSLKVKWGYISAHKLESEHSKRFTVCISLQTKAIRTYFRVPETENIPEVPGNRADVGQNHHARKAVSATL